jgi:dethiobiotin synthetase
MPRFVVTATDTDIGKTVFAAALADAIGASYWKPIQAGTEGGTDSEKVAGLGVPILPECYRLSHPLSPHRAAELDGIVIDPEKLTPPDEEALVIEGAGGVLVPVTRSLLFAELFARWGLPVILCARTALGTINHSLLSIEALRARGVVIHGIAFIGEANEDSEATIAEMGNVRRLGRLPRLNIVEREPLRAAFAAHFDRTDFR